jgi:hypothetical protein
MTEELYESIETDMAQEALKSLPREFREPLVVIGGWGVYLTVNRSFVDEHGASYLGSKDIDLGFHIDGNLSPRELKKTSFARVLEHLDRIGYTPSGSYRYCKIIRRSTQQILTEEDAREVPIYDLFYLYVDLLVDHIHPDHNTVFKIKVLDEPLLARAFDGNLFQEITYEGYNLLVPTPEVLLAMKLKSLPNRQKDDKLLKDACDIYALLWHSPIDFKDLISTIHRNHRNLSEKAMDAISDEIEIEAARHLGVEHERYSGTVNQLRGL